MTNWCHNGIKSRGRSARSPGSNRPASARHENEQARLDFSAIDPMPDFFGDNDAPPHDAGAAYWA